MNPTTPGPPRRRPPGSSPLQQRPLPTPTTESKGPPPQVRTSQPGSTYSGGAGGGACGDAKAASGADDGTSLFPPGVVPRFADAAGLRLFETLTKELGFGAAVSEDAVFRCPSRAVCDAVGLITGDRATPPSPPPPSIAEESFVVKPQARRRRRRKRGGAGSSPASSPASSAQPSPATPASSVEFVPLSLLSPSPLPAVDGPRRVRFGHVRARLHARCMGGGGGVPSGGAWSLGLADEVVEGDVVLGTVDAVEAAKGGSDVHRHPHAATRGRRAAKHPPPSKLMPLHEAGRRALLMDTWQPKVADANTAQAQELEAIRHSRTQVGCQCSASIGRRMSAKQLRKELAHRGVPFPPTASKPELAAILKTALSSNCLCLAPMFLKGGSSDARCPCAVAGVGCHSLVCNCGPACANAFGHYAYSPERVDAHRGAVLAGVTRK